MPNGRNAGILFPDCEGHEGWGQSHSILKDAKEGDEVECHLCHRKFKIKDGHLEPLAMEIEERKHDYRAEFVFFPERVIVRTHPKRPTENDKYETVPQDMLYTPARLLERFVGHEDQPCDFDHHGICQVHPGAQEKFDCPVAKARKLLYD